MGVPNDLSWRWTGEHSVFPPGRALVAEASLARKTDAATPATRAPPFPMLFFFSQSRGCQHLQINGRPPIYRFLFKCLWVSRNTVPALYATGKDPDARGDMTTCTHKILYYTHSYCLLALFSLVMPRL